MPIRIKRGRKPKIRRKSDESSDLRKAIDTPVDFHHGNNVKYQGMLRQLYLAKTRAKSESFMRGKISDNVASISLPIYAQEKSHLNNRESDLASLNNESPIINEIHDQASLNDVNDARGEKNIFLSRYMDFVDGHNEYFEYLERSAVLIPQEFRFIELCKIHPHFNRE